MKWFELKLFVPEPLRDPVSNRLFELGAQGVSESDSPPRLLAYFDEAQRPQVEPPLRDYLASLASLFPHVPPVELEWGELADQNWADNYKKYYTAQPLTGLFFLKPAWDEATSVPEEMIPIVMDPGQAFGTGLHASTRLAMRLLERAVALYPDPGRIRLLDVGTGSGILAIAAAKLGVGKIEAFDIDPLAVEAANENFARNQCASLRAVTANLSDFHEPVDILVSNILLETHKLLVNGYRRLLRPGGQLILSGLLTHQKAELEAVFQPLDLAIELEESLQEWGAFTYLRRGS